MDTRVALRGGGAGSYHSERCANAPTSPKIIYNLRATHCLTAPRVSHISAATVASQRHPGTHRHPTPTTYGTQNQTLFTLRVCVRARASSCVCLLSITLLACTPLPSVEGGRGSGIALILESTKTNKARSHPLYYSLLFTLPRPIVHAGLCMLDCI